MEENNGTGCREERGQNRKAGKIDRNFDDFAVNLNADEIPISWTEKGLLRVGRGGGGGGPEDRSVVFRR